MKGWGPIPGVKKVEITSGHTEMAVGLTQTSTTTNGGVLRETVLKVDKPNYFEYEIEGFSPPFNLLIKKGGGYWRINEVGDETHATWGYNFIVQSPVVYPISFLIVKSAFRKALQNAVENAREIIETNESIL